MRAVLWLVAAFMLFYGGYWFVGSRALIDGTEAALADLREAGLASYASVGLTGFPSRFDLTVTEPELVSADGAVAWQAPQLQVYALSYRPHHVIAVLPGSQTVRLGRERIAVTSDDLRASAVFGLDPDLPLARAQSVGKSVALSSDRGWGASAGEVRLAVRQAGEPARHEFGAEAFDIAVSGEPAGVLSQSGLPEAGGHLRIDGVLGFDRPLDRFAPEGGVRITDADIRAFDLDWGPLRLTGKGQVAVSASGQPEGRLELDIRNWRAALPVAVRLGLVRPELAETVENALAQLALADGSEEDLSLPLVFTGGRMSLGPIPLGPAPRF